MPISWFSPRRVYAYARCETLEILRDPIRLTISFCGTVFLMLVFGYGITMDVEHLSFAVLDRDLFDRGAGAIGEARCVATFVDGVAVYEDAALEG